jgi:ring-1,2-phenylacetyl-CoA epoxidase subunit PaaB
VKVYEVFLRRGERDTYTHAGSLEAPDDDLAVILARETYLRRAEGQRAWIVAREDVVEVDWGFIAPNADRPHRQNDGSRVAARRRSARDSEP